MTDKTTDMVERAGKAIYELLHYDEQGEKPSWVERGNSLKQDEARRYARVAMAATSIEKLREFYAATQPLLDWLNATDLCADHEAAHPKDYKRLCAALMALTDD